MWVKRFVYRAMGRYGGRGKFQSTCSLEKHSDANILQQCSGQIKHICILPSFQCTVEIYWFYVLRKNDSFLFIYLQNTRAMVFVFRLVEASHMLQCRGTDLFLEILLRPTECDSSLLWTLATAIAQLQVPNLCLMKEAPELLNTKASTILTSYLRFKESGVLLGYKDWDTAPFFLLIGLLRKGLRDGICSQESLKLGLPWWLSSKEYIWQCRRCGFDAWVGKIPWKRKWSTHSSILAWEIPWREEHRELQK